MKNIIDMITEGRVIELNGTSKQEVIKELVDVISNAPEVQDKDDFYISIMKREEIMSTGIGIGIAVPHAKIDSVSDFIMAIGRTKKGVEFDSIDEKPVYIIIMIGANTSQQNDYIKVLAKVSSLFKKTDFREKIINAESSEDVLNLIKSNA